MKIHLERTLNIYLNALPEANNEYQEIGNLVKEENLAYSQD